MKQPSERSTETNHPDKLLISNDSPRLQVFSAIDELKVSNNCKYFLERLCKSRNPRRKARVYGKIQTYANKLRKSHRQTRRYIKEAEEAGYLYVEEQHNGRRQINNEYYFTKLVFDPDNAHLKEQILAIPLRRSKKSKNPTIFTRPLTFLSAEGFQARPGGQKCPTKPIPLIQEGINTLSLTLSQSQPAVLPITPRSEIIAPRGGAEIDIRKLRRERRPKRERRTMERNELDGVIDHYLAGMGQKHMAPFVRKRFKETALEKKIPIDVLKSHITELTSNPLLKASTWAINRVFDFDRVVLWENRLWKKFEGKEFVFKEISDHLPTQELQQAWMVYYKQKVAVHLNAKKRLENERLKAKKKADEEESRKRREFKPTRSLRDMAFGSGGI